MKKILICGDSFAADWSVKYGNIGWPNMLAKEFKVTNLAQAGCSEYKILKQIESVKLKKFDYIIISHTSPYRLYVNKHPIHYKDVLHKNSDLIFSDIEEYSKINSNLIPILDYYKNYFDLDYALDIHNLICEKIDNITKGFNTVHISSFDYKEMYTFPKLVSFIDVFKKYPGQTNHYNQEGNQIVFDTIKMHL